MWVGWHGCGEDVIGRRQAALREANPAVGSNEVYGALHDETARVIQLSNLFALIHEKRKREAVLLAKSRVARAALRIQPEHRHVLCDEAIPPIAQLTELPGSTWRAVARIENQQNALAPPGQFAKRPPHAIFIRQREARRGRAHRQRIGEERGKHYLSTTRLLVTENTPETPFA